MTIDAHQHFWRYNAQEFDWISDEMAAIRRNFEPHDLQNTIQSAGIDGVVSVQARQTIQETEWLLNLAREADFVRGVLGWVPLAAPEIEAVLERFSRQSKSRGVRHVVQGEVDGFLEGAGQPGNDVIQNYKWMDVVQPYVKSTQTFNCPSDAFSGIHPGFVFPPTSRNNALQEFGSYAANQGYTGVGADNGGPLGANATTAGASLASIADTVGIIMVSDFGGDNANASFSTLTAAPNFSIATANGVKLVQCAPATGCDEHSRPGHPQPAR